MDNDRQWTIEELETKMLLCRDTRHMWEGAEKMWSLGRGIHGRLLICFRCGTKKTQVIHNGRILNSRMEYQDDYLRPKGQGHGRVKLQDVRLVLTARTLSGVSVPRKIASAAKWPK